MLRCRWSLVLLCGLIGFAGCGAEADSATSSAAAESFRGKGQTQSENLIEQWRLEKQNEQITKYLDSDAATWFDPELIKSLTGVGNADNGIGSQQRFVEVIDKRLVQFEQSLKADHKPVQSRVSGLSKKLAKVSGRKFEVRALAFELDATQQTSGQLATIFAPENRWLIVFALVAATGTVLVLVYYCRHALRRATFGVKTRGARLTSIGIWTLGGFVVFTGVVLLFGPQIHRQLMLMGADKSETAADKTSRDIEESTKARAAKQKTYDTLKAKLAKSFAQQKSSIKPATGKAALNNAQVDRLQQIMEIEKVLAADIALEGTLLDELVSRTNDLRDDEQKFIEQFGKSESGQGRANLWRALVGVLAIGLIGGVAVLMVLTDRRDRRVTANTCPLCMGIDTLTKDASNGAGDIMVCNNRIETVNEYGEARVDECNYRFQSVYRSIPKLCLPLLGVPQAGKTVAILMVYRELNNEAYPEEITFEAVKSASSDDFDRKVEDLLMAKMEPGATQVAHLPDPVVFGFKDRDKVLPFGLSKSQVLVNVFDYSGEIVQRSADDFHRRRALDADGYFFFIDPTFPREPQLKALRAFREDVRTIMKVEIGKPVNVPIAVCVSKLDLLVSQSYAVSNGGGTNLVGEFYNDLRKIDPTGTRMDLDVIRQRSELAKSLLDVIWPQAGIERQIDKMFGGRCMFFPMTPFGLDDLDMPLHEKVISPFGILEPLLWLLHMNGYPVLPKTASQAKSKA